MQSTKNQKGRTIFEFLKGTWLHYLSDSHKIKPKSTKKSTDNFCASSPTLSLKNAESIRLQKPIILSDIINYSYQDNRNSWQGQLTAEHLVGVIGTPSTSDLQLPTSCFEITIGDKSQINSLIHLRPYCFDYIFSINYDRNVVRNILKCQQTVLVKASSDQDLKALMSLWECQIVSYSLRNDQLLKSVICKLFAKIQIVNGSYWVTFNQKNQHLISKAIENLGIFSIDNLLYSRMKSGLTARQYWSLQKIQKQMGQSFNRNAVIEYLLANHLIAEEELPIISRSLSHQCPQSIFQAIQRTKNSQFLQSNQKDQKFIKYDMNISLNGGSQTQSLFFLHKLDRYEGIQGEEDRYFTIAQPGQRGRHRSRSCCIETLSSDEMDTNNYKFCSQI